MRGFQDKLGASVTVGKFDSRNINVTDFANMGKTNFKNIRGKWNKFKFPKFPKFENLTRRVLYSANSDTAECDGGASDGCQQTNIEDDSDNNNAKVEGINSDGKNTTKSGGGSLLQLGLLAFIVALLI